MKKLRCSPCLLLVFLLFVQTKCFSQPSKLSGAATNSNGTPLSNVIIQLKGATMSCITDTNGQYSITNIPAGSYTITASLTGYEDAHQLIALNAGDSKMLYFRLKANKVLDEIVVTGVAKATLVKENPVAVLTISSRAIQQTTAGNIIDVLVKNAPGLNAVKTGPNISKPFIRGLGYSRVLTLYDGMRQEGQQWGDEHGLEVDAYNIDRAEIIKGPSSLMYGSDALAGVVSLMPWVPAVNDGKLHGQFTSEYQQNNNLIGNGLKLGIRGKHWLAAVRGSYRIAKNYRNSVDGRVYNTGFEERNATALVGYRSRKGYTHLNLTLYDNLQGIPDGSRDSLTRKFTMQVNEGSSDDIKVRPVVSDALLSSYKLSPLHQHIQHYRAYTTNHYELGKGAIDALLGFQQNIRREYTHPTSPGQAGLYVRLNTYNYGVRYDVPSINGIESSIGINGMAQDNKSLDATDFPIPDYRLLDGGIYAHLKWKRNQWTITGGARYDLRHVGWNDFYLIKDAAGYNRHISTPDSPGATPQFSAFSKTYQGISGSLGTTFAATRNISLKANIARGYRAPNITESGSNGLDPGAHIIYLGNRDFKPEFSLQEDAGVLLSYRDVSGSVSIFNNNIQDYIYLTLLADAGGNAIVDAQGNKTYQYEQASARLYGAEASLSIHPEAWPGFSFDNSYSSVYGFNTKHAYKEEGTKGQYLPLIPPMRLTSNISQKATFKNGLLSTITPKAGLEYNGAQNRYLGLNNTETATPAYTLLDATISVGIRYSKSYTLTLEAGVNNILDKAYQSAVSRLKYFEYYSPPPNGNTGIYSVGRNFYLKLLLPF